MAGYGKSYKNKNSKGLFKNKNAINARDMLKESNGRTYLDQIQNPTLDDKVTMETKEWERQRNKRLGYR